MDKLEAIASSSEAFVAATRDDMKKLSEEVHKTMVANGFGSGSNCHTECSVSVGSDGKPVVTCRLVCSWP